MLLILFVLYCIYHCLVVSPCCILYQSILHAVLKMLLWRNFCWICFCKKFEHIYIYIYNFFSFSNLIEHRVKKQTYRTHNGNYGLPHGSAYGLNSNTFCQTSYSTTAVKALDEILTKREMEEAARSRSIPSHSIQYVVCGFPFK